MEDQPGRAALLAALRAPRRHLLALAAVCGATILAVAIDTRTAYYAAALLVFAVWMGWFVLTANDWLGRANF